jgi:tRNA pseudouridine32 synthase / 23S rRNA pseudouridine746 synthase
MRNLGKSAGFAAAAPHRDPDNRGAMSSPTPSLPLIYADDALIAVNKPAELPSVPGRSPELQDCAIARIQQGFPDARVVHRLDMATSGLLIFGRGSDMQRSLSQAFEARAVTKVYEAVVWGTLPAASDVIDLPLLTDWLHRPRQKVDFLLGKPSQTAWEVMSHSEWAGHSLTRLKLMPRTGRSHQLRVHLAAIGHCIVGDTLYAHRLARDAAPRLLLHACELRLPHPLTRQALDLRCAVPF